MDIYILVSTSAWRPAARVQYLTRQACYIWCKFLAVNIGNVTGTVYPYALENHINVSPILVWYVKESLRTTSTLAVTTLIASI